MIIEEIFKRKEISIRSYNVCKSNQVNTLEDLLAYYSKYRTFLNLKNCGLKSNIELSIIYDDYKDFYKNPQPYKEEKNLSNQIVLDLTGIQIEIINNFILVKTNNLSVRSKNAISLFLNQNFSIKHFSNEIFLSKSFSIKEIKNAGPRSIPELETYISVIHDFLIEVIKLKDEKQLISLKNNFLIQNTFSTLNIPNEILQSESIFLVVDFLLKNNALFDKIHLNILKKAFNIYKNQKVLPLEEIANEVKLSKPRVNQIIKACFNSLFNKLLFIQNFNDDLLKKYNIDVNANQIEIDTNLVDNINNANKINLSPKFITYILSVYLSDKFSLIGNIEDVIQPKFFNASKRHNWNNFFLIEKSLATEINFNALVNDLDSKINDRIKKDYSVNFKSYLAHFLANENNHILDLILPIAEKIVSEEFGLFLYIDSDKNILFKRNTFKRACEYAYEALEILGKPSKVKEIYEKVVELYPSYNNAEAKIKSSLLRKDGFINVGRTGKFGLIKWRKESDYFHDGTIRSIVEEYLLQFGEPKHITKITNYVLKYRPKSSRDSILQNLKIDKSGLYVFYVGPHVGLSTKNYNKRYIKLEVFDMSTRKSWEERFETLKNFTQTEKRLPHSNGVPEDEIKIFRWLNFQKNEIKKGNLDKPKASKINKILENYKAFHGKRRFNSVMKYDELLSFVKTNKRVPTASRKGEVNLYQFYYKQRLLFHKKELEAFEEIKFDEVSKLIQKFKK